MKFAKGNEFARIFPPFEDEFIHSIAFGKRTKLIIYKKNLHDEMEENNIEI